MSKLGKHVWHDTIMGSKLSNTTTTITGGIVALSAGPAEIDSGTLVLLKCDPQVLETQTVSLSLAGLAVPAQPFTSATADLMFQFPAPPLASGSYAAQLQVDGVDSPLSLPPAFTGPTLTL